MSSRSDLPHHPPAGVRVGRHPRREAFTAYREVQWQGLCGPTDHNC